MSDVATSYKWHGTEAQLRKSGDNASAKTPTSPRRTAVWLPGPSYAGVIRFAQSGRAFYAHLCGVFGRRRATTTNRDEY